MSEIKQVRCEKCRRHIFTGTFSGSGSISAECPLCGHSSSVTFEAKRMTKEQAIQWITEIPVKDGWYEVKWEPNDDPAFDLCYS